MYYYLSWFSYINCQTIPLCNLWCYCISWICLTLVHPQQYNLIVILRLSERLTRPCASYPDSDVTHPDPDGVVTLSWRNSCLSLRVTLLPERFWALVKNVPMLTRSHASWRPAKNSDIAFVEIRGRRELGESLSAGSSAHKLITSSQSREMVSKGYIGLRGLNLNIF